MLQSLMDVSFYEDLRKLRETLPGEGVSNIAHVFVPVGPLPTGEASGKPCPRVLFVGRATRDYAEDTVSTYPGALAQAAVIVREQDSSFWWFVRRIATKLCTITGRSAPEDFGSVCGWSNLAKIGDTEGNTTPLSLKLQAELCCAALGNEIALMKPDAVVIMTGGYGKSEIFDPVFGADDWIDSEEPTSFKRSKELGSFLVHTYHPERKSGSAEMADLIAGLIAKSLDGD